MSQVDYNVRFKRTAKDIHIANVDGRRKGILTEEEFQKQKNKLLS